MLASMSWEAPQPLSAQRPADLITQLLMLKVLAGNPSLSDLSKRTRLPRSTIGDTLNPRRPQLPPLDRLLTIVRALGVPPDVEDSWAKAWYRLSAPDPRPATGPVNFLPH